MRSRLVFLCALLTCLVATNLATFVWTGRRLRDVDATKRAAVERQFRMIARQRAELSQEPAQETLKPFRDRVTALVASEPMRAAVYIEFLNNGATVTVNQMARFWPASLAKVPIAITAMKTIEDGEWNRAQTFPLMGEDRQSISSDLFRDPVGTPLGITQLLEALLERSDNTAYKVLLRNLPPQEIEELKQSIGLDELFDSKGRITAKEYSRFFESLYSSNYLHEQDSEYLLELLDHSNFHMFLRKGLPPTIPFAHKWGSLPQQHTYGDAGIVYAENRPYVITVLVEGDGSSNELAEVEQFMHDVSQMTYDFVTAAPPEPMR